jgi:predicted Holliday junction resolvase-like endonuclease
LGTGGAATVTGVGIAVKPVNKVSAAARRGRRDDMVNEKGESREKQWKEGKVPNKKKKKQKNENVGKTEALHNHGLHG